VTLPLRAAAEIPAAGRKAQTLARMLVAGLPVPDGVVVLPDEPLDERITLALAQLGPGPYAVRSSSSLEDGEGRSAAGLYESRIGVAAPEVAATIRAVRDSASGAAVGAYLAARGLRPTPIAVLLQPAIAATSLLVARGGQQRYQVEARSADAPEWADVTVFELPRGSDDPLAQLLARVEALLPGALDVELARVDGAYALLQARPASTMRAPPTEARRWPAGRWRFDAEHNPDPISPAQAGLVALVDGPRFGARARVIDGYLYVREALPTPHTELDAAGALRRFHDELEPVLRAELAAEEGAPLPRVLEAYRRVVRRYAAEVRPALGGARAALDRLLHDSLGGQLADHGRLLGGVGGASAERDAALYALGRAPDPGGLRDYLLRYGAYAPAWDVAVPCDEEAPERVLRAAARRALGPSPMALAAAARAFAERDQRVLGARLSPKVRAAFDAGLATLRTLLVLGEDDDLLFFEGQRLVRRALLARGAALSREGRLASPVDVFFLALSQAMAPSGDLRDQVEAARAAQTRSSRRVAPFRIVDGTAHLRLPDSSDVLRGRPVGGQAKGRAVVIRSLTQPIGELPAGAVLVLPAALPSLAPHLPQLAGLVTEHGGALSHAATLAREAGVAAVVGVAGALDLVDGVELYVDGDRGRVLVLRPTGPSNRNQG